MRRTRHFQIGVVSASVTSTVRSALNDFARLYAAFEVDAAADGAIEVNVAPRPRSGWHRRRCDVTAGGCTRFEPVQREHLLPYIEWAINWEVPRVLPAYLHIHAAAMEVDGQGVMLPGGSGSGKSTLAAGLLTRGWRYLCDEFALVTTDTLCLHPYPRAICIKRPAFPAIGSVDLHIHAGRTYLKGSKGPVGFIGPATFLRAGVGRPCPVRFVVFPKYTAGAAPTLIPMSRGEAAFALHHLCFNLLACDRLGIDVIANMVRQASCYRLIAGDMRETCSVMETLVSGAAGITACSA